MHQNGQRTIVSSPRRPPGQAEGLPRRPICAAPKSCGCHSRLSGDTVTPVIPIPITTRCRKLQQQEAQGGHGPQLATSAGAGAGEPRRRGQERAEQAATPAYFPRSKRVCRRCAKPGRVGRGSLSQQGILPRYRYPLEKRYFPERDGGPGPGRALDKRPFVGQGGCETRR